MKKSLKSAFTLIELMVVVLIIGVLAAVGVPSYKQYLVKSKKTEVYRVMSEMTKRQVIFYSENQRFKRLESVSGGIENNYLMTVADNWKDLGYPSGLPGSATFFQYSAFAGKFADDGSELDGVENPGTGHDYNTTSQNIGDRDYNGMGSVSPSGACWIGPLVSLTFAHFVNTSPGRAYDWVVMVAKQDSASPADPQDCDFIFKVLEAYPGSPKGAYGIGGYIELKSGPAYVN